MLTPTVRACGNLNVPVPPAFRLAPLNTLKAVLGNICKDVCISRTAGVRGLTDYVLHDPRSGSEIRSFAATDRISMIFNCSAVDRFGENHFDIKYLEYLAGFEKQCPQLPDLG